MTLDDRGLLKDVTGYVTFFCVLFTAPQLMLVFPTQ